jgi:hypothetical protein
MYLLSNFINWIKLTNTPHLGKAPNSLCIKHQLDAQIIIYSINVTIVTL